MLAFLSPAKSLDFDRPVPEVAATRPTFAAEAETLAAAAAKLGPKRLRALMGISEPLAKLNAERFRAYPAAAERAAVFAFAGDVYQGLHARSLDPDALAFAQGHLRILSGLYGLLQPFDLVRPYRLEMGTRWAPGRTRDLYAFWGERLAAHLAGVLAEEGSGEILNLASAEYWHALAGAVPAGVRVVAIDFRERKNGVLRFNSFAAKRARGRMARWMCEERIGALDAIASFAEDGWRFDEAGSEPERPLFIRAVA